MTPESDTTGTPERRPEARPHSGGPHGVTSLLGDLLTALSGTEPGGSPTTNLLGRHLQDLGTKLDLVLAEHEGMGNELLHAYEQLGIVFEITRRLASVDDEDDLIDAFIDCLRAMFAQCDFRTLRPDEGDLQAGCVWDGTGGPSAVSECLVRLVAESTASRRATVCDHCAGGGQTLACPIYAGQEFVCALVLTRGVGFREFTSADMLLMDSLCVFCGDIIRNRRLVRELRQMSINMVRALVGTIDQKDGYTSGHSTRVGFYACRLAQELGWSEERLQILEWSALLHDVGKIGIRDDVLNKAGKLTPEEFDHMKEHPVRSSEVVCQVPQLAEAIDGVLHHHEHWNGKGYPDGLVGEDIPLQARIIQIADIFDALTTSRSYRKAFTWQKALSILREEAGVVVDPNLMAIFEGLITKWAAREPARFERMFEPDTAPPTPTVAGSPNP